jgi:hypothetical protein
MRPRRRSSFVRIVIDAFLSEDEHAATKEILLRKDRHPPHSSAAQLCRWLDVPAEAQVPLSLLTFSEIAPELKTFELVPLSTEQTAARLRRSLFFGAPPGPGAELFRSLWPGVSIAGADGACAEVASRATGLVCRIGRRAFAQDGNNVWRAIEALL